MFIALIRIGFCEKHTVIGIKSRPTHRTSTGRFSIGIQLLFITRSTVASQIIFTLIVNNLMHALTCCNDAIKLNQCDLNKLMYWTCII